MGQINHKASRATVFLPCYSNGPHQDAILLNQIMSLLQNPASYYVK